MLALERRNLILEKLQVEKRVVVSELSQLYDVSEETIRRDLDKLEKEGLAIKSYGGAVINEDVSIDLPFNVRKNQNVTGKQKMHRFFYIGVYSASFAYCTHNRRKIVICQNHCCSVF